MTQTPPEMQIQPARGGFWRNFSPVWLVPILAIAVSGWIGWRSYADRGVLIEIVFASAAGVVPGETAVRLREVQVGHVESVSFGSDLTQVMVAARIDRAVAELLPPEAEFWVVRPEVSARGITGLGTVLSGVYIETAFLPSDEGGARSFTGRETMPLITPGRAGTLITLRASDGNRLSPGAPVLHRGIEVGHIESPTLADGAEGVLFDAFIDAPHDRRITTATRFWDTSGFSVSLGTGGVRLGVGNLASILTGGIAFDEVQSGGAPLAEGMVFELFSDEASARRSLTLTEATETMRLAVEFDESVQGLTIGAEVRYRGIPVGEVAGIAARLADMGPAPRVRMQALMVLDPRAFGLEEDAGPEALERFIAAQVAAGLRARLAPTGLFSTSLLVELVDLPEAPPEALLTPETGAAVIPSAPSDLQDLTTSAQGLIERLTSLPIEEVLEQAVATMTAIEVLLADPDTRAAPGAAVAVLDEARTLLATPALQALPADVQGVITDVQGVVADLRGITAEFAAARAAERLVATLDSAQAVADGVAEATGELPALMTDLRVLAQRAGALELEGLVASATSLIANADAIIGAEDTQALPPALTGAMDEVQGALVELRMILAELSAANAGQRLIATLDSAQSVADNLAEATGEVPELVTELRALVSRAAALELEALMTAATSLVQSADAFVSDEGTQALPPALTRALDEVQGVLAELRAGGVVENVNQTLSSASSAADAIALAAQDLPALAQRLDRLVVQAEGLVAAYGPRSPINDEALATLRDARATARAFAQLARAIERNPNSLLFGR